MFVRAETTKRYRPHSMADTVLARDVEMRSRSGVSAADDFRFPAIPPVRDWAGMAPAVAE